VLRLLAPAAICCSLLSGCYFLQLAGGQLELLNGQQPLERAYAAERDPERRHLLARVPDIHSYATTVVQLRPGRNYTGYFETEAEGVTAVLVAAEKTRFEPHTWWFPITGEVPYKSFFDEQDALDEQATLEAEGYDTWLGHATAYSTLGILRDPVTTIMMRRGLSSFVEVLFHEMAHARLYVAGQTDWNEQLASFVGQRAAENYVQARFAEQPGVIAEMQQHFTRRAAHEDRVASAIATLERLYDAGLAEPEVLRRRSGIFAALERDLRALFPEAEPDALKMNNARLLQYQRYDRDSDEMNRLWRAGGGSWVGFWANAEARAQEL